MGKLNIQFERILRDIPVFSVLIKSQKIASQAFIDERKPYIKKQKLKCFFFALLNPRFAAQWFQTLESPEFRLVAKHRPKLYFIPFRPYISIRWKKKKRVKVILDTYRFILRHKPFTKVLTEDQLEIAAFQLPDGTEAYLKLGYDYKYRKEGELALTFECEALGGVIAAAAFSMEETATDRWLTRIGCVQGHSKNDLYSTKAAQKLLHGLRSKSLVVFAVQEFSRNLGLEAVYGAGDTIQTYRGKHLIHIPALHKIQFDYNAFWEESGATPVGDGWYELPLKQVRKDIQEIKTNKRALYTRRYNMMDDLSEKIAQTVKHLLS